MKKLLLLSLVSVFVFYTEAMEQKDKGKRKRPSVANKDSEQRTEREERHFMEKVALEACELMIKREKRRKLMDAGDMIEKNLLILEPNEKQLYMQMLGSRMLSVGSPQKFKTPFSEDFLEAVQKLPNGANEESPKDKKLKLAVKDKALPDSENFFAAIRKANEERERKNKALQQEQRDLENADLSDEEGNEKSTAGNS